MNLSDPTQGDTSMSTTKSSKRIGIGIYRVTLANGAEATVSRDNACDGDTGTGRWQWEDRKSTRLNSSH